MRAAALLLPLLFGCSTLVEERGLTLERRGRLAPSSPCRTSVTRTEGPRPSERNAMLKLLEHLIPSNGADAAAGGIGIAGGLSLAVAGATGQIPDGVPPWLWMLFMAASTICTPLVYSEIRVRRAARGAKKRAAAAERRRLADEAERQASKELADADVGNDEHARKLLRDAAAARVDAAGLDAEAEQLDREATKNH